MNFSIMTNKDLLDTLIYTARNSAKDDNYVVSGCRAEIEARLTSRAGDLADPLSFEKAESKNLEMLKREFGELPPSA